MHVGGEPSQRMQQLELLSAACQRRRLARVVELGVQRPRMVQSHFLALRSDSLLMEWPSFGAPRDLLLNADVDIYFEHDGRRFACATCTRGQMLVGAARTEIGPVWRMALPRTVEPREQRASDRLELRPDAILPTTVIDMEEPDRPIAAEIVSLSNGGLRVRAAAEHAERFHPGQALRIDVATGPENATQRIVARAVHLLLRPGSGVEVGCRFLPGEDSAAHTAQILELDAYVRARTDSEMRRARGRAAGGL